MAIWDLALFGIILIQPTAPMPSFGVIYTEAHGYVVTAILCALVAMLFTGNFLPGVPYVAWTIFFAALFTLLNLSGVETSARITLDGTLRYREYGDDVHGLTVRREKHWSRMRLRALRRDHSDAEVATGEEMK